MNYNRKLQFTDDVDANFQVVRKIVAEDGNLHVFEMGTLRNAQCAEKLGSTVRKEIIRSLEGAGLGFFPPHDDLPKYQDEMLRVYVRGTPVGRVIEAVLSPSADGDRALREIGGGDASAKIEMIREVLDS